MLSLVCVLQNKSQLHVFTINEASSGRKKLLRNFRS